MVPKNWGAPRCDDAMIPSIRIDVKLLQTKDGGVGEWSCGMGRQVWVGPRRVWGDGLVRREEVPGCERT